MTVTTSETIQSNLAALEGRIVAACERCRRGRDEVRLVAVTKGRCAEALIAAYRCGLHHLGENRIEELEAKRPEVENALAPAAPTWHMIGHVQSRKAGRVAALADIVHSVDSIRLAERLNHAAEECGRSLPVLLQVNVSGEETKSGFPAQGAAEQGALIAAIADMRALDHLTVRGLMTIGPLGATPEITRDVFRRTRELWERAGRTYPDLPWDALSMGMTDDFEIAIEEGATLIRIGRALFEPHTT